MKYESVTRIATAVPPVPPVPATVKADDEDAYAGYWFSL